MTVVELSATGRSDGDPRGGALEEAIEAEVEPRHPGADVCGLEPPRRREALAEGHLLVEQLGRPVTQAPRLDENYPGALLEQVGE